MTHASSHCACCPTRPFCLARDLQADGLARLAGRLSQPRMLDRGQFIYRCGDRTDALYLVRSGAFKTIATTRGGEEHVTGLHFPGEVFGLTGFTTGIHDDSAMAQDTSSACQIRTADLPVLWEIGCDHAFLQRVGERESTATRQRILLGEPRAQARVAMFLMERSRRQSACGQNTTRLYIPLSRTDLANYLGMTLENLSRVIGRLAKSGLIGTSKSEITLLQPEAVSTLADSL